MYFNPRQAKTSQRTCSPCLFFIFTVRHLAAGAIAEERQNRCDISKQHCAAVFRTMPMESATTKKGKHFKTRLWERLQERPQGYINDRLMNCARRCSSEPATRTLKCQPAVASHRLSGDHRFFGSCLLSSCCIFVMLPLVKLRRDHTTLYHTFQIQTTDFEEVGKAPKLRIRWRRLQRYQTFNQVAMASGRNLLN